MYYQDLLTYNIQLEGDALILIKIFTNKSFIIMGLKPSVSINKTWLLF